MNAPLSAGPQATSEVDLAIVGDGAAAALVALRALQQAAAGTRIALIGPGVPGVGIAYATDDAGHRLNVPAGKMSALAEQPGDFVDFLRSAGLADDAPGDALASRYVPRGGFAAYLAGRLRAAVQSSTAGFEHIARSVIGLDGAQGRRQLQLDDGRLVSARQVVLAVGNALRPLPLPGAHAVPPACQLAAWEVAALRGIAPQARVLVVGTGLTMADVVVSLRQRGHQGPIHAVSRHGLLPLPHVACTPWAFDAPALLAQDLRGRVRALRAEVAAASAAGQPWQAVFEAIRPLGARLWTTLSAADQARFLRHVVRQWDVHRHRIAPDVDAVLQAALADGQLQVHAGGATAVQVQADGSLQVGRRGAAPLAVDVLVNATGLQVQVERMSSPLLQGLLAAGLARPGPHRLGLDVAVDAQGMACLRGADGQVQPDLYLVGSLRMGAEWETIAIPELRAQAAATARAALQGA